MAEARRVMRADARENRARVLAAATDVIEQEGTTASLNQIAQRAGVGPGTLYRHFPTRELLLAEVLQTWAGRVTAAANRTVITSRDDLIDWLERLAAISNTYRGLAGSLASTMGDDNSPLRAAHSAALEANETVFNKARANGLIAGPVDAVTVARLVTGVAMVAEQAVLPRQQIRDMLDVVLAGLISSTSEPATKSKAKG
ncbi:TetR/AcrR family transcriptional regulator [Rhodococcus fascians]|nr:TetR/AcrR family transcriptional regulator [Rhodococcus fascians]MBY3998462.1 TetR/AcrR family transcriptional regulator [Rhodococcus fascians]MBY4004543.1 TetR/AcrR family transcriptional regulator [Rhodococcus fascians]MBY4009275.1 TetR/AcrR family transcriptional regulator [Rhodococcus fascians]MBY4019750.1 TetR/AcrR family transcriptional regulator [Rhodococcus fascians]